MSSRGSRGVSTVGSVSHHKNTALNVRWLSVAGVGDLRGAGFVGCESLVGAVWGIDDSNHAVGAVASGCLRAVEPDWLCVVDQNVERLIL